MSDKKRLIMEAALEVFSQRGYKKTKISEIVSEAGVAQGTFYLYFKSKKDVFLQLIDLFLGILYERMTSLTILDAETGKDIENQIRQIYRMIFITYKENKKLAKIFLKEAVAIDLDCENKLHEFYRLSDQYIRDCLKIGVEKGIVREYDDEILSYAIIGMVQNVAYKFILLENYDDIEKLVENMAKFECYGLIKQETY